MKLLNSIAMVLAQMPGQNITPQAPSGFGDKINQGLNFAFYIGIAMAIVGVMVAGITMAVSRREGSSEEATAMAMRIGFGVMLAHPSEPHDASTSAKASQTANQATPENTEPRDTKKTSPTSSTPKSTKTRSEKSTKSATSQPGKGIVDNYTGEAIVPPSSPWTPPGGVTHEVMQWLGWVMYVGLALSMLSIMMMGVMMMIDRNRGEPMSSSDAQITAMRIAIGLFFITGAASLAKFFA